MSKLSNLRSRMPWRGRPWLSSALVVIALSIVNYLIIVPYYIFSPGSARGVQEFVEVPAEKAYPPKGDVLFTTVSLRQAHPFDLVWAWITPGNRIEKKKNTIGDLTPRQFLDLNDQLMTDSKQTAIRVAAQRAGIEVKELGDGAFVRRLAPGSPAEGRLAVGDVITEVDSTKVGLASDLTGYVRNVPVGTVVNLTVTSAEGTARNVDLNTAARPDGAPGAYIGVVISTKGARLDTPFPIGINTTRVGGPSAGLAFTLSLLDELTPGDLTGGRDIAVTGTIEPDGSVGEVGGVEQKTKAVEDSDAKLFLVPPQELKEATEAAGKGLKVVGVSSLDDAIKALAANGGDVSGIPEAPRTAPAA